MSRACLDAGSSKDVPIALYIRSEIGLFLDEGAGAGAGNELEYDMVLGGVDGPAEADDMKSCEV